jgi:hypothetical protein
MLRNWGAVAVAASMLFSTTAAIAADTASNQGALAPGKPAGVKQAQMLDDDTALWLLGGAVVIGGIVLVATGTGNGSTTSTTTSTTVP